MLKYSVELENLYVIICDLSTEVVLILGWSFGDVLLNCFFLFKNLMCTAVDSLCKRNILTLPVVILDCFL